MAQIGGGKTDRRMITEGGEHEKETNDTGAGICDGIVYERAGRRIYSVC